MGQIIKEAVRHNYAFWICLGVAIILLVVSFFIPPIGEVTPTTLKAVAELWAFGALGSFTNALEKGLDARVKHGDTSLEVGDFNNKPKEDDDING